MTNYKLIISYDGTRYNGFQRQSKHPEKTIQGKVESVLSKLFDEDITITASGRTDAGVHSKGQVCNFHSKQDIELNTILSYLREYLPMDISVVSLSIASPRFHSRYNVVSKTYSYTIDNGFFADPFTTRYAYHLPEYLDLNKMIEASKFLLGEHDFASFTSMKSKTKSTVRTIKDISFKQEGNKIIISYTANGFLQHMVRILTGTLIEIGLDKRDIASIKELLDIKTRSEAGFKAPPHGLCMEQVLY